MDTNSSIKKSFRAFAIWVGVLYVVVLILGTTFYITNQRRFTEGQQAHKFLCIQHDVLKDRIRNTALFLKGKNPDETLLTGELLRLSKDKAVIITTEASQDKDIIAIHKMEETLECN